MNAGGLRKRQRAGSFIPRGMLRDPALSWKAKGLLANLLDRPVNWVVRAKALAEEGPDGRDKVESGLRELRACGYYRLERRQGPRGQLAMGGAISEEAVTDWIADYAEYGSDPVPVVWRDGRWWVRHKNGTLTPDGFDGYEDGDIAPDEPDDDPGDGQRDDDEALFTPDGNEPDSETASPQVTPGTENPVPENPGPGKPAPGNPVTGKTGPGKPVPFRGNEEGEPTRSSGSGATPTAQHQNRDGQQPGDGQADNPAAARQRRRKTAERTAEDQAHWDTADEIASTWYQHIQDQAIPIVGSPFVGLRKMLYETLRHGGAPENLRRALVDCGKVFPSRPEFQEALARRVTGRTAGGRRGPDNAWHDPAETQQDRDRRAGLFKGVSVGGQRIQ